MSMLSQARDLGPMHIPFLPPYRVQMMPVVLGDVSSYPVELLAYQHVLALASGLLGRGEVGYITVDNRSTARGRTMRTPGWHVDGAGWGGIRSWGGGSSGMVLGSSLPRCEVALGTYRGEIGPEGEADNIEWESKARRSVLKEHRLWHADGATIHRTLPAPEREGRCFVRVSGPSDAPWHTCNTPSPLGVLPQGPLDDSPRPMFGWSSSAPAA